MPEIRKLKYQAVLWGVLVDTVGTVAAAMILFSAMAGAGFSEAEVTLRMHSLSGLLLMLILGLGFTLLGGYVAGRIAKHDEILHGALVAGVGLVLGLFLREPGLPLWYEIISFAAMLPIGMAGGYLAKEGNARRLNAS
jgi:hypothetical protein